MQTIEIDFDVFKELTLRRSSEEVTYNDVLRETLELPPKNSKKLAKASTGKPWVPKGVTFPHGTELRAKYKGQIYYATVEDGALVYDGKRFSAPSPAATAVTNTNVDGWWFWEYRAPNQNEWVKIAHLRGA